MSRPTTPRKICIWSSTTRSTTPHLLSTSTRKPASASLHPNISTCSHNCSPTLTPCALPNRRTDVPHSGGEEVLLDVGGQDATEAFEDVGHSDEAREILEGLLVGNLKRVAGDPPAKNVGGTDKIAAGPGKGSGADTGFGVALYGVLLVGGLLAFGAYQYLQSQDKK